MRRCTALRFAADAVDNLLALDHAHKVPNPPARSNLNERSSRQLIVRRRHTEEQDTSRYVAGEEVAPHSSSHRTCTFTFARSVKPDLNLVTIRKLSSAGTQRGENAVTKLINKSPGVNVWSSTPGPIYVARLALR